LSEKYVALITGSINSLVSDIEIPLSGMSLYPAPLLLRTTPISGGIYGYICQLSPCWRQVKYFIGWKEKQIGVTGATIII